VTRDEICDLLRRFVTNKNNSVLFSTHITADLDKTADYIIFILDGRIVYSGTKERLLERYAKVTGSDIAPKELVIGYKQHETGFEGMVAAEDLGRLPKSVLAEAIRLDERIIFMSKGAAGHA
jgi:ABC-2 type transport system ATP-binding protein